MFTRLWRYTEHCIVGPKCPDAVRPGAAQTRGASQGWSQGAAGARRAPRAGARCRRGPGGEAAPLPLPGTHRGRRAGLGAVEVRGRLALAVAARVGFASRLGSAPLLPPDAGPVRSSPVRGWLRTLIRLRAWSSFNESNKRSCAPYPCQDRQPRPRRAPAVREPSAAGRATRRPPRLPQPAISRRGAPQRGRARSPASAPSQSAAFGPAALPCPGTRSPSCARLHSPPKRALRGSTRRRRCGSGRRRGWTCPSRAPAVRVRAGAAPRPAPGPRALYSSYPAAAPGPPTPRGLAADAEGPSARPAPAPANGGARSA